MWLGAAGLSAQANGGGGGLEKTQRCPEFAGMPPAVMAPPRLMPPSAMTPRPPQNNAFTSPSLSLAPPIGLEGQAQVSLSADSELMKKDEEYESRSGSENMEGGSGDEHDPDRPPRSKKRYHRHTPRQIQEMEMLFKECPHPDDKQRQELSKDLGLEPRQVKFWFQNRRTQMKMQQERAENSMLRAEVDKVRSENMNMREAMKNASCPHCGGPTALGEMSFDEVQQLRLDNERMRDELERVSAFAAKYMGQPLQLRAPPLCNSSLDLQVGGSFGMHQGAGSELMRGPSVADIAARPGGLSEAEKPMVFELAAAAMEEFLRLAHEQEPLWVGQPEGSGIKETLNYDEYVRCFPRGIGPKPFSLKTEATRDTGLLMMNGVTLVNTLLDHQRWTEMFPCLVSRAVTVEVLSPGVAGSRDNALQVMYAEIQVLSPLVPTREMYFLRYCKQHAEGVWAVVDVSIDSLRDNPPPALLLCRRRPSGCLIQDMPNGYSKITCVEHVAVDDRAVNHMYKPLVNSGMAFGAQRWLATLQRQCERLASVLASNLSPRDLGGVPNASGRRSLLKLAQRMTNNFCAGVSASSGHTWTAMSGSGDDDVRVMTRKSLDNPGEPHGIVLSAATSLWLPVSPQRVFEFLRNESLRQEWDILSNGGMVAEMAHIAKGQDPGNSVSLLRVDPVSAGQSNMLILQESCTDISGSLVIYAPVDIPAMNLVLHGGDQAHVALLPSGFAILPDGPDSCRTLGVDNSMGALQSTRRIGSMLTVAFQILVSSVPSTKLNSESITTVNNLISCTVQRIKNALHCDHDGLGS